MTDSTPKNERVGEVAASTDPKSPENPTKENGMTTAVDNTARPAMPDADGLAQSELFELDGTINHAQVCSLALDVILDHTLTNKGYRLTEDEAETILHLASEADLAIKAVRERWNVAHQRVSGRATA
ncbi:hypothetical protein [Fulvimarina sp. MAC3]|uniref:hypothetical protein n=1 Tax=Fulvimarina sp. MAC3 TaxID=3148887 RepID=UPI0031FCFB2C